MKSRNVDFRPEKLCTTNTELEFPYSSKDVVHNEDNDSEEVDQNASRENHTPREEKDANPRPVRRFQQPARFDDYEVGHQFRRLPNSQTQPAFACLAAAVQRNLEPTSFNEAMEGRDSKKWLSALKEEIKTFQENETWDLV